MFSIKPKCKQILNQAKTNPMHPVWYKSFNQIELLEEHKHIRTFNSFHLKYSKWKSDQEKFKKKFAYIILNCSDTWS